MQYLMLTSLTVRPKKKNLKHGRAKLPTRCSQMPAPLLSRSMYISPKTPKAISQKQMNTHQKNNKSSSRHPISLNTTCTLLSIVSGPHTNTNPPSPSPHPAHSPNNSRPILPLNPSHPSPACDSVCKTLHLPPLPLASPSNSSLHKISPTSRFPSSTVHAGPSSRSSRITARST